MKVTLFLGSHPSAACLPLCLRCLCTYYLQSRLKLKNVKKNVYKEKMCNFASSNLKIFNMENDKNCAVALFESDVKGVRENIVAAMKEVSVHSKVFADLTIAMAFLNRVELYVSRETIAKGAENE